MTASNGPDEPAQQRETGLGWPGEQPRPAPRQPAPRQPAPASEPPVASGPTEGDPGADRGPTQPTSRPSAPAPKPARPQRPQPAFTPVPPPSPPLSPPRRRTPPYLPPERPGTVTAAAVLLFVGAGLVVLACCGIAVVTPEVGSEATPFLMLAVVVMLAAAVFNALLGYYILQGRQWARITTIVLCSLGIVVQLGTGLATASADGAGMFSACIGIVVNGIIIGLLSGATASDYFRRV